MEFFINSISSMFVASLIVLQFLSSTTGQELNELPSLLDFDKYQRVFGKHYDLLEETARRSYFIPRALRVYTSALSYKYRKSDYHLALNHLSDALPAELEMLGNSLIEFILKDSKLQEDFINMKRWKINSSDYDLDEELEDEYAIEHKMNSLSVNDGQKISRKRSWDDINSETRELPPRDVNLNDLINTGKAPKLAEIDKMKLEKDYKKSKFIHRGVSPDRLKLVEVKSPPTDEPLPLASSFIKKVEQNQIVFLDHSQYCMAAPRDQGFCSSCYAFASIAIYEWLYCMKFNKLIRFSEQYMVDCSKEHIEGSLGCQGGNWRTGLNFVRNFGLELYHHYPYTASEHQCPIDNEKTYMKSTGYIRFNAPTAVEVPYHLWMEYLRYGPLAVGIVIEGTDFHQYARGIHNLTGCDHTSRMGHAMVLVGFGIEDNKPFWKIRNSYSTGWGEQGYYRMIRDERGECFRGPAVVFGSENGRDRSLHKFKINKHYDRRLTRKHYWKTLRSTVKASTLLSKLEI